MQQAGLPADHLELSDIDDDAFVWLGKATGTGSALLRVDSGSVPRAGRLDVTRALRSRNLSSAQLTVKIGNGGGFGSKGVIRGLVNGDERVRSEERDNGWKHTGWTHCVKLDVDVNAGTIRERCSASCASHLDCHDDCGSQCTGQ
jgi:hypothetical protein